MTPLKKDQKEDIARRLDFIAVQFSDLKKFSSLTGETYAHDRDVQRNIERLAENIGNAAIDISKVLLAGEDVEMPNSYREIIIKIGEIGFLERALADQIAEYASLRNVLAHQYLDIKWEKIKGFMESAPSTIPKFLEAVGKKIED